jgi:YbbR domain-containing protein
VASFLHLFTNNWKLKLLAFTLAVLLWIVVSAEEVTSRWIDIPLQVRVTDPEYMLDTQTVPREVSVRFSGPRRELIDLRFRRPPLVLNIIDVDDVRQSYELQARMVQIPTQLAVTVVDMQPSAVNLRFTRVESRFYSVRVRLAEPLPAGWVLVDSLVVQPGRIRVTGPEARLAAIDSLLTVPITLPRSDTSFTLSVPIDTTNLQGLRLSARRVELSGRVDVLMEQVFSDVTISTGPGLSLSPATVDIRLRGSRRSVQAMTPADFRVVVAIDTIPLRIPEAGILVPLRLERLPANVQGEISPSVARLFPSRLPSDTLAVPRPPAPTEPADTIPPLR